MVEVLWLCSENRVLIDFVVAAHTHSVHDGGVGIDDAVVAYFDVALDICEGIDGDVLSELRLGVDICFVADIAHGVGNVC